MSSYENIPETMRALVLAAPNDVRHTIKPVPKPGPGEVLVKVEACGICGTDVKIITKGMPNMPAYGNFTFGHEWAGTVVQVGETVDEFKVGDRVAIEAHKGCGRCENCLAGKYTSCLNYGNVEKGHRTSGMTVDGGFAEYAVHHINALFKIPDNISFEEATYVTTLGCALYAIDTVGGYLAGDSVLVTGPGPIGLSVVQGAHALGAENIILLGTNNDRLNKGKELGATHTINIKEEENPLAKILEITGGKGCEKVFECAGSSASLDVAIKGTKKGGDICLVSFFKEPATVSLDAVVLNNLTLHSVRGEGRNNCKRALSLMSQGVVKAKPIMTHTFSLEEFEKGYDYFVNRKDGAMKVVIMP